jgi:hypothetical protein
MSKVTLYHVGLQKYEGRTSRDPPSGGLHREMRGVVPPREGQGIRRATSLIRNSAVIGPYSRIKPRVTCLSQRGGGRLDSHLMPLDSYRSAALQNPYSPTASALLFPHGPINRVLAPKIRRYLSIYIAIFLSIYIYLSICIYLYLSN